MQHRNITLSGKVQGVGFRWATLKEAQKLSIVGFVRNQSDGSLYIEAEGNLPNLENFISWCRKGPLWAKVASVEISDGEVKVFSSFEII